MFEVFEDTAPLVEGLSIDEAFLDVRGLGHISGRPAEIAVRLRREVRDRVGLPITVGVARTKFLAKVASGVAKPDGLLIVPAGVELAFLHPLPVGRLWGVGPVTRREAARARHHDRRAGGPARRDHARLDARAAPRAGTSTRSPTTATPRAVRARSRRRSMGAQRALGRGPRSPADLDATLVAIVDRLGRRLRASPPRVPHGGAAASLSGLHAGPPARRRSARPPPRRRRSSPPRATSSPRPCR